MTSAEIGRAVVDLGDYSESVRSMAATQLRAAGKPAFFALITALDSPSSLQRHEAAQIIRLIADDLASRPIPEEVKEEERQQRLPTEIEDLVAALENPDKVWRQSVEKELNKRKDEAFMVLLDVLKNRHSSRPDRIVRLLGEWGELRAVAPLLNAWDTMGSSTYLVIVEALTNLAKTVARRPTQLSEEELLRFVIFARQELGTSATPLGDALCTLAQQRPTLGLRLFLPHLKGRWLHPVPESFEKARQAILVATRHMADLPLPAKETDTTPDLPRPAESISDSGRLPKPTERIK